ncbi:hypothetical protein AB0M64_21130 [Streptomyces sp. NPDC051771]|uniref:hypothetical protein n=1 Tax=Streptomyces sp. NPDC051771 TaxID=3154847 RepID=UPI00342055D7
MVLADIGTGIGSVVLDLDCAPYPAPGDALATVDTWAAGRGITVVALTPSLRPTGAGGVRRAGVPALRAAPAGLAEHDVLGVPSADEALVRQLRRVLGVRALVHQAAGIRQARRQAHPCA